MRRLCQRPGFTLTALASLALGIGANTAIFSLVNTIILRRPPVADPGRLVNAYIAHPEFPYNVFSYPDFDDLRRDTTDVFSGWSASSLAPVQLDRDGSVSMIAAEVVNGDYFSTLGVGAHLGRMLTPDDDRTPGAHPVVVLGHGFWRRAFGADPGVIGRDLRLAGRAYTIVGVADESYAGSLRGLEPAFYVPLMMINELMPGTSDELQNRGNHSLFVKARLADRVTLAQAQVATEAVADRLRDTRATNWDPQARFVLVLSASVLLYPPFDVYLRASGWLLVVVVGLVLLMACTNLASFLLAHAVARRGRRAAGAGRLALDPHRPIADRVCAAGAAGRDRRGGRCGLAAPPRRLD